MTSTPTSTSSTATNTGVAPVAECIATVASRGSVSMPTRRRNALLPSSTRRSSTVPAIPAPVATSTPDASGIGVPEAPREHGIGQRMFTGLLDRCGVTQHRVARPRRAWEHFDGDHPRPALGDRAGLVEQHHVDLLAPLDGLAAPDQDAQLCATPGAHHDRRRHGEAHGTGAGDDEHGDRATSALSTRGSGPSTYQAMAAASAIAITTGTKMPAIRSARRWIGARVSCASRTSRMMRDSTESAPVRVTRTRRRRCD